MIYGLMERTAKVDEIQHEKSSKTGLQHFGSVIEAGDFRLDLSQRAATLRGLDLDLTGTEFDVLLFLANHRTNVVTISTNLITNWGNQAIRRAEFLHILSSLRQKIAALAEGATYLNTETLVLCRFNPSGSKRP